MKTISRKPKYFIPPALGELGIGMLLATQIIGGACNDTSVQHEHGGSIVVEEHAGETKYAKRTFLWYTFEELHVAENEEALVESGTLFGGIKKEILRGPLYTQLCMSPCAVHARVSVAPQKYEQTFDLGDIKINDQTYVPHYHVIFMAEPKQYQLEILLKDYSGNKWPKVLHEQASPLVKSVLEEYERTGQTVSLGPYLDVHLKEKWAFPFTHGAIEAIRTLEKKKVPQPTPQPTGCANSAYRNKHPAKCAIRSIKSIFR